jgi:hypothetical protein
MNLSSRIYSNLWDIQTPTADPSADVSDPESEEVDDDNDGNDKYDDDKIQPMDILVRHHPLSLSSLMPPIRFQRSRGLPQLLLMGHPLQWVLLSLSLPVPLWHT